MEGIALFGAVAMISLAIAAFGSALGQGRAASAAYDAMARQPEAASGIQTALIISLAFMEALTLFVFAMVFILAGQIG